MEKNKTVTLFPISLARQLPLEHFHQDIKQRLVESPANSFLFLNLIQLTMQKRLSKTCFTQQV